MKQLTPKQVQKIVDQFNRKVKIGDEVFYYPVLSKNCPPESQSPKRLKTKSEAWILGGHTAVVYLEGVGNVAVTHCFPVKENELFQEQQMLFKTA
ncbi:MAG: hypothetical protein LBG58_15375 [Planctomycetaceae bacterium]|jgi:hypothetical protein|nr:hypothetical protein [Planctomycetaceae bacterium]